MEQSNNNETFTYSYSAREQEEIRRIRDKYRAPEERETKLERLHRLDQIPPRKAATFSTFFGTIFSLIMGTGMAMCMEFQGIWFIPGIVIGCIGLLGVCLAYPLYRRILKKEQTRLAPEILALSEELLQ